MKSDQFDKHIKDKLEGLNPSYHPERWEAFNKLLETQADQAARTKRFDRLVSDKLKSVPVPGISDSWNLLNQKIREARLLNQRIVLSKVFETVFVLLIPFLLFTWYTDTPKTPQVSGSSPAIADAANALEDLPFPTETAPGELESDKSDTELDDLTDFSVEQATVNPGGDEPKSSITSPEIATASFETDESDKEILKQQVGDIKNGSVSIPPPAVNAENALNNKRSNAVSSIDIEQDQDELKNIDLSDQPLNDLDRKEIVESSSDLMKKQFIALDKLNSDLYIHHLRTLPAFQADESGLNLPIRRVMSSKWAVNMFGVIDYNFIQTPFDEDFKDEAYEQGQYGLGGGITFSRKLNRLNLNFGVIYHTISYEPKKRIEIFDGSLAVGGYYSDQLIRIELNQLQLPLQLTYNVFQSGRLNLSVLAGLSSRITLQSFYDYQQSFVTTNNRAPRPVSPGPGGEEMAIPSPQNDSKLSQKPQPSGILEDGNLEQNYFLSADAGLELVYWSNDRYGLMLQSVYQRNLLKSTVGPNKDRFHTLSFLVGVKNKF